MRFLVYYVSLVVGLLFLGILLSGCSDVGSCEERFSQGTSELYKCRQYFDNPTGPYRSYPDYPAYAPGYRG